MWLAEEMPEILDDAEWEIQNFGIQKRRRLKALHVVLTLLCPEADVELVKIRETIS